MDAVIVSLEGGEGLRPVPVGGTVLGARLLGRSLLEWNALAFREAGAARLVLALGPDAEVPGQEVLPVDVRRFPAGTGELEALAACGAQLKSDFFALRAGLLWEGDLHGALEVHEKGGFALTQVGLRPETPRQGGTGRVLPFPAREGSGLVLCSPALLLFLAQAESWEEAAARLRSAGVLGRAEAAGRWDRIDSPAALLGAVEGLLSAKRVPHRGAPLRPGIWSRSPIPEDVELVPPCAIGARVALGKGSLIGPHAALGDGVQVGAHSLVQRSILQEKTTVGNRAAVYGAVVCRGAALGDGAVLNEGAAVGPGARLGDGAALMEGVRVDAGVQVPPAARLTEDCACAAPAWTVEDMVRLGRRLGRCGLVGTGGGGFRGLLLARAFGCGAAAQGAEVVLHDGTRPDQAAWLAGYYRWPVSLFAGEDGQVYLFDAQGQELTAPPPDGETGAGSWDLLAGTAAAFSAAQERGDAPAQAAFRPCGELELL